MGTFYVFIIHPTSPTRKCAHKGTFSCWRSHSTQELTPNTKKRTFFVSEGISCPFPSMPTAKTRPHRRVFAVGIIPLSRTHKTRLYSRCILCVQRLLSPSPAEHKNTVRVFVLGGSPSISPNPANQHENVPMWAHSRVDLLLSCSHNRRTP